MRERRPGTWEIRLAAGTDPTTGRTLQRSVTFHGTRTEADAYRLDLAAARDRLRAGPSPLLTVGELVDVWLAADHRWKPSTRIGYQSNARHLRADAQLAGQRAVDVPPPTSCAAPSPDGKPPAPPRA